ncbi:transglycosylase domain-containing protein, partial [Desulfovibrio sp. OttesenSCG-928-O18]|nr:transglycosylase domain-containing protein [Desulfovibrio sp. OttesenSCG-928-O18]
MTTKQEPGVTQNDPQGARNAAAQKPVKKSRLKRFFVTSLVALVAFVALGTAAAGAMIWWASRDLPPYQSIADYRLPLVTTVYARDNSVMGYLYNEKRFLTALDDMPKHLQYAFVAAEDGEFFEHCGINPKAILRAFINNLLSGRTQQGGSTITQQIVKRLLLTPEKSYVRKLREAILAIHVDKYLGKAGVLNIYLNEIYLGNTAYGV